MTSRLVNQMIPRFQISSWKIIFLCTLILLLTLFVNFFYKSPEIWSYYASPSSEKTRKGTSSFTFDSLASLPRNEYETYI